MWKIMHVEQKYSDPCIIVPQVDYPMYLSTEKLGTWAEAGHWHAHIPST